MTPRWPALALISALACCKGANDSACQKSEDCAEGEVCFVPLSGGARSCTNPPFGIALVTPGTGAVVGARGIAVEAHVTLASAEASGSEPMVMLVDDREVGKVDLIERVGELLTFRGRWVPENVAASTVMSFGVALKTSAGIYPSQRVLLEVQTAGPAVTAGAVSCPPPCRRDAELEVNVELAEGVGATVEATLDLDGHVKRVSIPQGASDELFGGPIPLGQWPFPYFEGRVTPRLLVRDRFGNEAVVDPPAIEVTRLRWVYDSGAASITGPALLPDGWNLIAMPNTGNVVNPPEPGGIIVATAETDDQLRGIGWDGVELWRSSAGDRPIESAPSVGIFGIIWLGVDNGKLYRLLPPFRKEFSPDLFLIRRSCPLDGNPARPPVPGTLFTPAIRISDLGEAYSAGSAAQLEAMREDRSCFPETPVTTGAPVTTSPVIVGDEVFLATAKAGRSTIKRFSTAPALEMEAATGCGQISVPMAVSRDGEIVAVCDTGEVIRSGPEPLALTVLANLDESVSGSPVLFPNGDILIGTNDGLLHRLTPPPSGAGSWTEAWSPVPSLGGAITGSAIAQPDPSGVVAYAVTRTGSLRALDERGRTVWSTDSALGDYALTFPTIVPVQAKGLPTLVVGSAEGKLYGVVVDTGLDTASPWPKTHHDTRNTGNAGTPLP